MAIIKLTLELDFEKESDRQLLELITVFKGLQAQGKNPSLHDLVTPRTQADPTFKRSSLFPSSEPLVEVGKEITQAAKELDKQVGDLAQPGKMNTHERARVAARARWAKAKAIKEGKPIPPPAPVQKKKTVDANDYSRAELQDFRHFSQIDANFQIEPVTGMVIPRQTYPDGKELLEGSWDRSLTDDDLTEQEGEDDEELRAIRERARAYESGSGGSGGFEEV